MPRAERASGRRVRCAIHSVAGEGAARRASRRRARKSLVAVDEEVGAEVGGPEPERLAARAGGCSSHPPSRSGSRATWCASRGPHRRQPRVAEAALAGDVRRSSAAPAPAVVGSCGRRRDARRAREIGVLGGGVAVVVPVPVAGSPPAARGNASWVAAQAPVPRPGRRETEHRGDQPTAMAKAARSRRDLGVGDRSCTGDLLDSPGQRTECREGHGDGLAADEVVPTGYGDESGTEPPARLRRRACPETSST